MHKSPERTKLRRISAFISMSYLIIIGLTIIVVSCASSGGDNRQNRDPILAGDTGKPPNDARLGMFENISDIEGNISSRNGTALCNAADGNCTASRYRQAPKEIGNISASLAPGYCPSFGGKHYYEYISKAAYRQISDEAMAIDVDVYIANPGGACSYAAPCGVYDASPEYVNAWIDWNCDQDFDDPGEKVMDAALTGYIGINYNGNMSTSSVVTIPPYAKSPTWMRVNLGWNIDLNNPCDPSVWSWGDIIDKPVIIRSVKLPEIKDILISPPYPVTLSTIRFTADVKEVPEFEIYKVNWHVLNSKDNSDDFSGVDNPCRWYNIPPEIYGNKKVKCEVLYRNKVSGAEGSIEKTKDFKLFFDKGTTNDPADDDPSNKDGPNWFEYWKKDKAVPNMEGFVYDGDDPWGYFYENILYSKLALGKGASGAFGGKEIILDTSFGKERFEGPNIRGIDCASQIVAHELYHKWVNDQWKGCGGSKPGSFCNKLDSDKRLQCLFCDDSLPDDYENGISRTSNTNTDTYNLEKVRNKEYKTYGDNEYMAMRAANGKKGIASRDWAYPGKQAEGFTYIPEYGVSRPVKNANAFTLSPAIQSSYIEKPIDTNGNQLYYVLRITLNISTNESGVYSIVSRLNDTNGSRVALENNQYLLSAGYNLVDVDFKGIQINRHGINGPYNLSTTLYQGMGGELSSEANAYSTAPYSYASFEGQQARLAKSYGSSRNDVNGDGIYETLNIAVGVAATIPGNYSIRGYLYDSNKTPLAFANASKRLDAGNGTINLSFSCKDIALKKANGSYNLSYLSLYDEKGTLLDSASDDYVTGPYMWADFFSSPGKFSGQYSDRGVDTNRDGYFEHLEMNISTNINFSGNYTVEGILYNDTGDEVADAHNTTYLDIGEQNVTLDFDGKQLYKNRINGSLNLTNLWMYESNHTLIDKAYGAHTTQAYNYLNFTPLIRLTGNYSDYARDNDSDGLFDNLTINVGVILANRGNCIAYGRLIGADGKEIAWTSSTTWLEGGEEQLVQLNFDGRQIYGHRSDGRYRLKDVYVYHTGDPDYPDYAQDIYTTANYSHMGFNYSGISITGTKFNDINCNGVRDIGEPGMPGWEIRLEQPPGTQILTGITYTDGSYILDNISSGTCWIKEEPRLRWNQIYPNEGSYSLIVGGQNITDCDFGNNYNNTRPSKPIRLAGPASGYALVAYNYTISAIDPDGDQINYTVDWGDYSSSKASLVDSGDNISLSHTWAADRTYSIRAKATDTTGASSE